MLNHPTVLWSGSEEKSAHSDPKEKVRFRIHGKRLNPDLDPAKWYDPRIRIRQKNPTKWSFQIIINNDGVCHGKLCWLYNRVAKEALQERWANLFGLESELTWSRVWFPSVLFLKLLIQGRKVGRSKIKTENFLKVRLD